MKKITILFAMAAIVAIPSFSQETTETTDGNYNYMAGGGNMGDGLGAYVLFENNWADDKNSTLYLKIASQAKYPNITIGGHEISPEGFSSALGYRSYFSKTKMYRGLFFANEWKYSRVKYKDSRFSGRYSYLSFFAPELGWKIMFGKRKKLGLEIAGGVEWAIEIKGKGDVDNKNFDNWKPKASIGLGYQLN